MANSLEHQALAEDRSQRHSPPAEPSPGVSVTKGEPPSDMPTTGPSGPRSGFWKRLLALAIDLILLAIVTGVLFGIEPVKQTGVRVVLETLSFLATLAYFVYLEGSPSGQTIGKRATGIRVIDFNTGQPIGYVRALGRNLIAFFISTIFLLGYLWMLWDKEKQTWHDKAVSSVVVPTDVYPVEKWPG